MRERLLHIAVHSNVTVPLRTGTENEATEAIQAFIQARRVPGMIFRVKAICQDESEEAKGDA